MTPVDVLLVDGWAERRSGVLAALGTSDGLEVVGAAETGEEALRLARRLAPDLVLLQLRLPGAGDGVLLCRDLKDLPDPPRVLLYGEYGGGGREELAYLLSGADGFLAHGQSL